MFIRCPKKAFSCLHHRMRWKKCHFHATAIGQRATPRQVEEPSTLFLILSPLNVQRVLLIFHPSPITHNSNSPIRTKLALSLECSRLVDCFISAALFFALYDLTWSHHVLEESARWSEEKKEAKKFVCHSRWHGHDVNRAAAAAVVFSVDFQLQRSWSLCRPNIAIEINMFSPRRARSVARSRIFFSSAYLAQTEN